MMLYRLREVYMMGELPSLVEVDGFVVNIPNVTSLPTLTPSHRRFVSCSTIIFYQFLFLVRSHPILSSSSSTLYLNTVLSFSFSVFLGSDRYISLCVLEILLYPFWMQYWSISLKLCISVS
jgi:hypothetical protein